MNDAGEWLALAMNVGVGLWFVYGYPRLVAERFDPARTPRAFSLLVPLVRALGWAVIAGTAGYALLRLFGR